MLKAWLLKLHRWAALIFALPLLVVLGTGLVLSFEPWIVERAITPGALTADRIREVLASHDAIGEARSISYRSYDRTLTIGGRGGKAVDVVTGQVRPASTMSQVLVTSRRLHETFLLDLGWLVIASSVAMLVLALLGILMGLPRISNTLGGWHKAMSWGLLPLVILSPLTGIFLAAGITFSSGSPPSRAPASTQPKGPPFTLTEAVRVAGGKHDLSGLIWLRPAGEERFLMRIVEDGVYRLYRVTNGGTVAPPTNWPRLWHEGNFAGIWSVLMNVVTSIAMLGLLITGTWIWARRSLRFRARRLAQMQSG